MQLADLQSKSDQELLDIAVEVGAVDDGSNPRRMDIFRKMFKVYSDQDESIEAIGILSILNEGYGFLRENGDQVSGDVRPPKDGERYFGLVKVGEVNGTDPDSSKKRPKFESLTPIFPEEMIILELSLIHI